MYTLGVIPARGGSKGIPRKNLYPLNGKPLIRYTIEAALESDLDDVVVTTDSDEIAQTHWKVIRRPPELAQDDTPMLPVIQHAVREFGRRVDAVVTLQPTSPLRTAEDMHEALEMFKASSRDSLVSVCEGIHPVKSYDENLKPFLEQVPYDKHKHRCYTRNGAIFITRIDLLDSGRLIGDPLFYVMPRSRSVDVDSVDDLVIATALLRSGGDG